MTDTTDGSLDLGLDIPTLEPDEAFVSRLASLAAAGAAVTPLPTRQRPAGWRVGLAAASVAAVVGGGAWLAAAVTGSEAPAPPAPPASRPADDGLPTGHVSPHRHDGPGASKPSPRTTPTTGDASAGAGTAPAGLPAGGVQPGAGEPDHPAWPGHQPGGPGHGGHWHGHEHDGPGWPADSGHGHGHDGWHGHSNDGDDDGHDWARDDSDQDGASYDAETAGG